MCAQVLSSSEESDFDAGFNAKKFSKNKSIILSDEEDCKMVNVTAKIPLKTVKKRNQLSLLSFTQKSPSNSPTRSPQHMGNSSQELVQCPICFKSVPKETIEQHADSCADSTSAEVLDIMSSQEETKRENLYDPEIFDCNFDANATASNSLSAKRPMWDLETSFGKSSNSSSHPSKRKKTTVTTQRDIKTISSSVEKKGFDQAPYPEFSESKVRGCLKNTGNNPGSSIQNLLKNKVSSPDTWSPPNNLLGQSSKGKAKASVNNGLGFKVHPFLAKASSSSSAYDSGGVQGGVVPDGDGGFIINDDVLDDASDEESFSLPPLQSNGFIDFKNQFKESSTPSKRKTKATSPRKRKSKSWRGKSRGRGRGRGRGSGSRGRRNF